jgi:hypothetical protein
LYVPEFVQFDVSASVQIGTITGAQTSHLASDGTHGPHTLQVEFPAGWPVNKPVTVTAPSVAGTLHSEVFTPPDTLGSVVRGSKVFVGTPTATGAGGGNGALTAQIQIGRHLCLAQPASAVLAVYGSGIDYDLGAATIDLTLGTIDLGIGDTPAGSYWVIYEVSA